MEILVSLKSLGCPRWHVWSQRNALLTSTAENINELLCCKMLDVILTDVFVNISVVLFCECRLIRVVGTHNTVNKVFHLVALECMYTQRPFTLEKGILGNVVFLISGNYTHQHGS